MQFQVGNIFVEVAIPDIFVRVKEAMCNFFEQLDYLSCTTDTIMVFCSSRLYVKHDSTLY